MIMRPTTDERPSLAYVLWFVAFILGFVVALAMVANG